MNPVLELTPPTASGAIEVDVERYVFIGSWDLAPPDDFDGRMAEEPVDFDAGLPALLGAERIGEPDSSPVSNGPFGV